MTRLAVPLAPRGGDPERIVQVGEIEVYPAGLSLRIQGVKSTLPLREFEVLLVLAENAGRVIPFETLMEAAWGPSVTPRAGTLKSHVNRLRRRIKAELGVDYIRTVRGVGYSLDPELAH